MSNILATTYDTAVTVTKSDTAADPAAPFAGLFVTVAGTLKFTTVKGDVVTLPTATANEIVPIAIQRVWSTGTSATVLGLLAEPFRTRPST